MLSKKIGLMFHRIDWFICYACVKITTAEVDPDPSGRIKKSLWFVPCLVSVEFLIKLIALKKVCLQTFSVAHNTQDATRWFFKVFV